MPRVSVPGEDALLGDRLFDDGDRLDGAAAQAQLPADDLPRATVDDRVEIDPAVLGDPDRRHVEMPELAGPLDLEEPWPAAVGLVRATLDQPPFAHHPQHPLAVDRPAQRARHPGGDDPVAVSRVALGNFDDRPLDVVDGWPPRDVG